MNKYQEAYEYLLGLLELEDDIKWPLVNQSMKAFKELVDKATPKMFKIKTDTDGRMIYVCPNCGNILKKFWREVETITMYNYCDNCGQALKYME